VNLENRLCDVETDRRDRLHPCLLRIRSPHRRSGTYVPMEEPSTASIADIRADTVGGSDAAISDLPIFGEQRQTAKSIIWRTGTPDFKAAKPSLIWPSLIRPEIKRSSFSRPCFHKDSSRGMSTRKRLPPIEVPESCGRAGNRSRAARS